MYEPVQRTFEKELLDKIHQYGFYWVLSPLVNLVSLTVENPEISPKVRYIHNIIFRYANSLKWVLTLLYFSLKFWTTEILFQMLFKPSGM